MTVWVVYDHITAAFDSVWSTRELAEAAAGTFDVVAEYEIDKGFK